MWWQRLVCEYVVFKSHLRLVGLSLGLSCQAARHGINLAFAAWHAIKYVDVEMLLDDIPDLVVLTLLQVTLQQLVGVARDPKDKLAGAKVQQGLVSPHVLLLGEAGQNTQVIFIIALLIPPKPGGQGERGGEFTEVCSVKTTPG